MKVFCPNCGTENEGMPGGRLTCRGCTASFEVPRGEVAPNPEPRSVIAPPPPSIVSPPPSLGGPPPSSSPFPTGYVGPPPAGFGGTGGGLSSGQTNPLAIVSLVLGIACCIPFASIGAIVTGVIAQNQINATNGQQRGREMALAGIILGALSLLGAVVSLLSSLLR